MQMKKSICILIVVLLLVTLVGCTDSMEEMPTVNESNHTENKRSQEKGENEAEANAMAGKETSEQIQKQNKTSIIEDMQLINQPDELLQYINQVVDGATQEDMDAMVERLEKVWDITSSAYDKEWVQLMSLVDNTVSQIMENYHWETGYIDSTKIENVKAQELIERCQDAGFNFVSEEGYLYLQRNYRVLDPYMAHMSAKMQKYITLMNEAFLNPYVSDAMIVITWDDLAARVAAYEEYLLNEDPTSKKIQTLYHDALLAWLTGMDNSPIIGIETKVLNAEVMKSYEAYPLDTPTAEIVSEWVEYLETNDYEEIYNDGLDNEVNAIINRHLGDITNQSACVYEEMMIDDSHKHVMVEMTYPAIGLKDNQAASDAINQYIRGEIEGSANWIIEAAETDFKDAEGMENVPNYGSYSSYSVEQNSQGMLSMLIVYSDYLGGAHGNYASVPYNYNTMTGELIHIEDFFIEGYDYNQKIIEEVTRQMEASEDLSEFLNEEYWAEGLTDYQIFYTQGLIGVIYAPYVIGPYGAGEPTFYIPFSYFQDGLR